MRWGSCKGLKRATEEQGARTVGVRDAAHVPGIDRLVEGGRSLHLLSAPRGKLIEVKSPHLSFSLVCVVLLLLFVPLAPRVQGGRGPE